MDWLYFALLLVIAVFAYLFRLLSIIGTVTAFLIGFALIYLGGINWFLMMLVFFAFTNLVSRYKKKKKEKANKIVEKGGYSRDAVQVFANSLFSLFLAFLFFILKSNSQAAVAIIMAFLGSVACVCADTFATEIGMLSKQKPLMITDFRVAKRGISGGVSLAGLFGSLIGAFIIAVFGIIVFPGLPKLPALFAIVLAGFFGAFADSILGAVLQAVYHCPKCNVFTEQKIHTCAEEGTLVKGVAFMTNDAVNFLSSVVGAIIAMVAFYAFQVNVLM